MLDDERRFWSVDSGQRHQLVLRGRIDVDELVARPAFLDSLRDGFCVALDGRSRIGGLVADLILRRGLGSGAADQSCRRERECGEKEFAVHAELDAGGATAGTEAG